MVCRALATDAMTPVLSDSGTSGADAAFASAAGYMDAIKHNSNFYFASSSLPAYLGSISSALTYFWTSVATHDSNPPEFLRAPSPTALATYLCLSGLPPITDLNSESVVLSVC